MIKIEQAKELINSMNESEQIMMLSLLVEVIWLEENSLAESIHNLVMGENAVNLLYDEVDSLHEAEVIDFESYKKKRK